MLELGNELVAGNIVLSSSTIVHVLEDISLLGDANSLGSEKPRAHCCATLLIYRRRNSFVDLTSCRQTTFLKMRIFGGAGRNCQLLGLIRVGDVYSFATDVC